MKLSDLDFSYPEELVALKPSRPSRVMWVDSAEPRELTVPQLVDQIPAGDILVINTTKVLARRVFAENQTEVLFIRQQDPLTWEVLFPASKLKIGDRLQLPLEHHLQLLEKGRPQLVRTDVELTEDYFAKVAELPLPPYIQKARQQRHVQDEDSNWYQTAWAREPGSLASPTASLHFTADDLQSLRKRGVEILEICLHVGLGTFLPVTTEDLDQHSMHSEQVSLKPEVWKKILAAKKDGRKVWALGTTVARTLESLALDLIPNFSGSTNLLIQPGHHWKIVDVLLTNFHQPKSTLLALVASFANLEKVKLTYAWAMERRFRLFSYGDLSVWTR